MFVQTSLTAEVHLTEKLFLLEKQKLYTEVSDALSKDSKTSSFQKGRKNLGPG
jgi:hypothetical protein